MYMREVEVAGRHRIMGVSFVGVLMGLIRMVGFIFVDFMYGVWVFLFYDVFVFIFFWAWGLGFGVVIIDVTSVFLDSTDSPISITQ